MGPWRVDESYDPVGTVSASVLWTLLIADSECPLAAAKEVFVTTELFQRLCF